MGPPSLTAPLRDAAAAFAQAGEPKTTPEVAEQLDIGRRTAYNRLERLAEEEVLETKKVGANARVWWRSSSSPSSKAAEFESLIDAVDEYAIFRLDTDGHVQTWNSGARTIKGYTAEEVVGEHFSMFYTDDDRAAGVPEANLAAAASQGSVEDEGWRLRADGTRFWANVTITALRDDDGALSGYAKVIRDMTHRRERERTLRRERDLTERLFETAPAQLAVFRRDGTVERVNGAADSALELADGAAGFERTAAEPIESAASVTTTPVEYVVETGESLEGWTVTVGESDADPRWLSLTFSPVIDADGRVERVVMAGTDITDVTLNQRELERERDKLERELADIFGRIDDAFFALDEAWDFTHVNDRAEEVLGRSREELLGRNIWTVFPEAVDSPFQEAYERAFELQESVSFEEYYPPLETWFEVTAYPSEDGLSVYFQDITDRKEAELKIERQRAQLAALNNLNEVVRGITSAVIEQSTRSEIEQTVCDRLADSDSYLFAWVGDVDSMSQTVSLRAEAGVEDYLEDITISVDADDARSEGPTGSALKTGEVQTMTDARAGDQYEPWRETARRYGFRSSAAVPILHEGTVYGVLNVYSDRSDAFEGAERELIAQLGEVVGHAIAAVERKQALLSDELVELEFQIDSIYESLGVTAGTDDEIRLEHTVPTSDDRFILFGRTTTDGADTLEQMVAAVPFYESVSGTADGEDVRFQLRLSEPPILSILASLGGSVEEAVIEDGTYRFRVHLSPSADVRTLIDTVQSTYPDASLLKRRQRTRSRSETPTSDMLTALTDRQRTVVETAYYAGFFQWPRDASGEDLAESLDIAAPTFHQHLRKAERKVFDAVFSDEAPL